MKREKPKNATGRSSYTCTPDSQNREPYYRKPGEKEPEAGEPLFGTSAISDPKVDYYGDGNGTRK